MIKNYREDVQKRRLDNAASILGQRFRQKQMAKIAKAKYGSLEPAATPIFSNVVVPKVKSKLETIEERQKRLKANLNQQILEIPRKKLIQEQIVSYDVPKSTQNQEFLTNVKNEDEAIDILQRRILSKLAQIKANENIKRMKAANVIAKAYRKRLDYKQEQDFLELENAEKDYYSTLIQNTYRNRLARKEFAALKDQKTQQQNQERLQAIEAAKSTLSRTFSSKLARDQYIALRNEAIRRQQQEETRKAREAAQEAKEIEELKKEQRNYNSILIQNAYRNRLARKQFEEVKEQKDQQKLQAIEAAKATLARAISTKTTRDKYITLLKEAQELAKKEEEEAQKLNSYTSAQSILRRAIAQRRYKDYVELEPETPIEASEEMRRKLLMSAKKFKDEEDVIKKMQSLKFINQYTTPYASTMVDNLTSKAIDNLVKKEREEFLDKFLEDYNKKKKKSIFSSIYSFVSSKPTLEEKEKEYERILEEIRKEEERKKEEQEQIKREVLQTIKEEDRERQRELKRQRQIENERKKREKEEKEEQERIRKQFEKPRMEVIPEVSREDITPDPDDDIPYTIKEIKKMSYEDIKKLRRKYIDEYSYEGREEELTPKRRLIYQLYKKGQIVEQPAARGPRIKDQYTNEELDNMTDEEFDVLFKAAFPDVVEIRKDTPRGYRDIYNASKRRATKLKITIEKLKIDKEVDKEFKAESKRIKENNDKFTIYTIFRDQAEKDFYVNFIKEELEISTKNYEEALAEANTLKERNEASTNFYADRYKKQKEAESLAKQNKTMVKFYDKILKDYKKIKV